MSPVMSAAALRAPPPAPLGVDSAIVGPPPVPSREAAAEHVSAVVFEWRHKGSVVWITGDFCGWRADGVKMERRAKDGVFVATLSLPTGITQYKFVVDGQWCYDPSTPFFTDGFGNINK